MFKVFQHNRTRGTRKQNSKFYVDRALQEVEFDAMERKQKTKNKTEMIL